MNKRLFLFCFLVTAKHAQAFLSSHILSSSISRRSSWAQGRAFDDDFDVDAAREKLESLVKDSGPGVVEGFKKISNRAERNTAFLRPNSEVPILDVHLPEPPPLTSIERERRIAEIEVLSELVEGDESIDDLWTLWFNERGEDAAQILMQADELTGMGPSEWDKAETVLRDLVEEYGVFWAEPLNRLATLCYLQGRFEEAEILCKIVLKIKPWHFGALTGIVMIYTATADTEKARQWAGSRLPSYDLDGSNRKRFAWVQKAVQNAAQSLRHAEQRTKEMFGEPDRHSLKYEDPEDVWQ